MLRRHAAALGVALLGLGLVGGCGAAPATQAGSGTIAVVASFYPLEYAVARVGGSHVSVTGLTKPGAEPHDVELSPKDVGRVSKAALVVYAQGFQPSVDAAVAQEALRTGFDVSPVARLDLAVPPESAGAPGAGFAASDPAGARDPHFWLDPQRYADVARAIAARLAAIDPAHASDYARKGAVFTGELKRLDAELRTGLRSCRVKDLVTSHAAFGYLSSRYGFTQVPIAGLSPDAEPSAARLATIAALVRERHVTTIYAETLIEPAFAETVSKSTGARLARLDPIEGLTSVSAGRDYLEVMRANLAALRSGQGCS